MQARRLWVWTMLCAPAALAFACQSDTDDGGGGLGASSGTGAAGKGSGKGGSAGSPVIPTSGGSGGTGGTIGVGGTGASIGVGGGAASGGDGPNAGAAGAETCAKKQYEQKTTSALDIYFVFDRTASMGTDCDYVPGDMPPVDSKACFATYAFSDYISSVSTGVDTRLAFQFMSQPDDCAGTPYETPLFPFKALPVASDDPLIQAISAETFAGGLGTHIEGALRGIAAYTAANQTAGREMIGVLMTDGDPQGCEEDIGALGDIIDQHLQTTGIRTFIIGMQGATDQNLEDLAKVGGADPHDDWCGSLDAPCRYWNVGNGSGDALASALTAIVQQAAPIPCEFPVSGFAPPAGQALDFGKVNVTLTDDRGVATQIGQVTGEDACPDDVPAWYYDDPAAPKAIELCKNACSLVTDAANGSRVNVVVGCEDTMVLPPIK